MPLEDTHFLLIEKSRRQPEASLEGPRRRLSVIKQILGDCGWETSAYYVKGLFDMQYAARNAQMAIVTIPKDFLDGT